jgi:hypothetical protein
LSVVSDEAPPEGQPPMVFAMSKTAAQSFSLLLNDEENIADFLSDYSQ